MTMMTRLLWIFCVTAITLFVVASGQTNAHNYEKITAAIEEIYEDRLVVKGLIFDMARLIHQKEIAQRTGDTDFYVQDNDAVDQRMEAKLELFRATKLTAAESVALKRFTKDYAALQRAERELLLTEGKSPQPEQAEVLADHIEQLKDDLDELSGIQIEEGRRRMAIAEGAESDMNLIANVESGMMVLLAVLLTALFFIPGPRKLEP